MDSVKTIPFNDDTVQRLHSKAPKSGHLHKGHSIVTHNSTIPTKFETYVIDNSDKHGFNSTTKRFTYEQDENICPGIGFYSNNPSTAVSESPSYSKRGTGSFASKSRYSAAFSNVTDGPGPNAYHIRSAEMRRDFNCSNVTRTFHPNIAIAVDEKSSKLPAPNTYHIKSTIGDGSFNPYSSVFKSSSLRNLNTLKDTVQGPGPGQYSILNSEQITTKGNVPIQSVFKSKSKRDSFKPPEGPGPTQYDVIRDENMKLPKDQKSLRRHYLCLAANALKLPPTPPLPGPGQYNVSMVLGEPHHFMSSSMFTSTSSRWTKPGGNIGIGISNGQAGATCSEIPGPAHYQPNKPMKQSFHYNLMNKWI